MTRRTRRFRILARYDTRAPLTEPFASPALACWYAEQQRAARQRMAEHDRMPAAVRLLDTVAGNDRVARVLAQTGCKTVAEAEARVREMLAKLRLPERHVR